MGNTIRRTPVSFDIPDSPDYEFLNIMDFRGIAISDNPFTLSSNTASDMLNLYVDETNTLTTRPRLEKITSIKDKNAAATGNVFKRFLGIYPLSIGFLVHYIEGSIDHSLYDSSALDIITDNNGVWSYKNISAYEITGEKLLVFEKNDKIYILDGNNYYVISYILSSDGVITSVDFSEVEGYVPTISVGGTNLITGTTYDEINLLSDKYKKTYFWDGNWNINDVLISDTDTINNGYVKDYDVNVNYRADTVLAFAKSTIEFLNGIPTKGKYLFEYNTLPNDFGVGNFGNSEITMYPSPNPQDTEMDNASNTYKTFSADGNVLVCYYYSNTTTPSTIDGGLFVRRLLDEDPDMPWHTLCVDVNYKFILTQGNNLNDKIVDTGANGDVVVAVAQKDSAYCVLGYKYNNETDKYDKILEYSLDIEPVVFLSEDGNTLICVGKISNTAGKVYVFKNLLISSNITEPTFTLSTPTSTQRTTLSRNGKYVISGFNGQSNLYDISGDTAETITISDENQSALFGARNLLFSDDSNKLYVLSNSGSGKEGYLILNEYDSITNQYYPVEGLRFIEVEITGGTLDIYTANILNNNVLWYSDDGVINTYFNLTSTEPLLEITHTIQSGDDGYDDWLMLRNRFKRSICSIAFDDNRWFGAKNTVFRTVYNDPTYISSTGYNELGASDEIITGFNLIQNDLLAVYKEDFIWLVTPTTVSQDNATINTYSYQEAKNTVGNTAINAPIISAYTEIPLQISYKGIYGIKQISNLATPDRISESMSDDIAKKWLSEDKNVIQKAQTVNNLYWTYVVLSYENMTKIYVLDNRTSSWYYWEFPISAINIFMKSETCYVSDVEGNIYTLQTSEIINKYNPDTTEYYDDGEKIINWFWKSQILPLGTINYSKRLIDTTFIFTDTDTTDEYSLDYKFTAYRKVVSQTNVTTLSNQLNYIQSTTKKTLINRCNFIQLELSNTVDDINSNKLRLVALAFKYVLLEGLL